MVYKKPGKGREDKSGTPAAKYAKGDSAKRSSSPLRSAKSPVDKKTGKSYGSDPAAEKKPYSSSRSKPSAGSVNRGAKPVRRYDDKPADARKPFGGRPGRTSDAGFTDKKFDRGAVKPGFKKAATGNNDRPFRKRPESDYNQKNERNGDRPVRDRDDRPRRSGAAEGPARIMRGRKKSEKAEEPGLIRLNRYISNAGICSRRKADELITAGVVSVNGEVVSELGFKVDPVKDIVRYNGETLKREKMVYVLLNKPKDYITTTDDPQERRTVMHLVEKASRERIYPVGRLDRNTTGLLLMTNDGDLADKLSHPRNNIVKLYQVELSKALTQGDMNKIGFGLELEDGLIKPDMIAYVAGGTKREVGIQIHSGKNRIVRRIFEHLGYEVVKLDRSIYANLTKKDLPRGRWRYLEEHEIIQLKHLIK